MYRKLITLGSLLVVALMVVNLLRASGSTIKGQSLYSSRVIPYTVVLTETATDANGVRRHATHTLLAVRKDGSTVKRLGKEETAGREINLAHGERIFTVPDKRMKTTMQFQDDLSSHAPDPQSQCTRDLAGRVIADSAKVLGEEFIGGYRTVKLEINGATQWQALDCGCAPVRTIMNFGKEGKSETDLLLLVQGEPDPSLFTVPTDYIEVKPSVAFCGGECSDSMWASRSKTSLYLQRLDEKYLKGKSQ